MGKWEANLPEVLIPDGEICVNVKIPNHPDYVKLFLRAMRMLEVNRMYERDEEHSAKIVCEQWRTRTLTPLIEALATGNGCPEDVNEFDCVEYPAFASFIEYVPDNPFDPNAEVPNNYLTHAWWKWGKLDTALPDWIDNPIEDAIEALTQYKPNDALTWLGSLPYNGLGEIIDNSFPFPYIKIHVTGKGAIRMNFLSFPLGGRIFAEVDEMPNVIDILTSSFLDPDSRVIDTDRDFTTFPMEQWPVIGVKLEVPDEGDHIIYCMLLPKVEAGIDFFGFGGGLRSVELCGGLRPINVPEPLPPPLLDGVTELKPEFQFTAECGLEYRLRDQEGNIVEDWQPVVGWVDNAAACFQGADGVDGEDGTDGQDGMDGEDGQNGGGNEYPPEPENYENQDPEHDFSEICGAANYIAQQLKEVIRVPFEDMGTITLEEFLLDALGVGGFKVTFLSELWDYLVANTNPDLIDDMLADMDKVVQAFFCNLLDREAARAEMVARTDWTGDALNSYLKALDSVTDSELNKWAFLGSELISNDCSELCSWTVVWDFTGDYEANEGEIVYTAHSWDVTDGELIAGYGYSATDGSMSLEHSLPPDCRVDDIHILARKHDACGQLRWTHTWRGVAGTDPTQSQSGTQFVGAGENIVAMASAVHAELNTMRIDTQNAICFGSGTGRDRIGWIRLSGTGAKPRA